MADWLSRATDAFRKQAPPAPETYEVGCDCGMRLCGERTSAAQRPACPTCGCRVFVLPANVYPLRGSVAAVSVGIVDALPTLDLDYARDVRADVDMNVVMTGEGKFIEIQGTGEEATFDDDELAALIKLAKQGIKQLSQIQQDSLGIDWPWSAGD